ncbi:two-component sensor histidine kinase [Paenibacillus marchantiophytorum]|uniref:histidine kinase n=1 Tax=Paenibacillus marchantiophytorum TaxID=1619310 RepID=A0ABQ2BMG2_9BACL|nr:sensor histidine kinase [Paenibacillus marchantiophytorum]GGI43133.1 two-component sensor histidine kinase [Paenibacillus marchantiophytorum]
MTPLLLISRYALILVPAVASMYLQKYSAYGTYVFFILLLVWIAELRRITRLKSAWMLLLEIGFGAWLSYQYDGILFMLFYSTLLSYVHYVNKHLCYYFISIQLLLLNLSLHGQPASYYVMANLIFIAQSMLLLHMRQIDQNREEVELLYDQLRRQHYELDEARMQLMDYAKQVENIAQTDERNRISRDIHDDLGHKLIRLKMMMEASLRILPTQQSKGLEMLTSVKDQLTESMELLRTTVRRLKPDEDSLQTYSLERLIADLTKENGIAIEVQITGMPYVLYPSLAFILYRNAQEAITNAIRHGSASKVDIQLTYDPKQITMCVSNNGNLPAASSAKGIGMKGMEERSKLIGGQLFVTLKGYYSVTTVLPTYR